jgi:purine-binding chemotaxis protein CheW
MSRNDSITQLLTFVAAHERYGMSLGKVDEVLFMMSFQDLPNMPSFVRGVINLRGELIAVLDFCERLGKPRADADSEEASIYPSTARMLLLRVRDKPFVLIVDEVERIYPVTTSDLHPIATEAPSTRSFLTSMWLDDGVMVPLVESEALLAESDWSKLPHSAPGVQPNA